MKHHIGTEHELLRAIRHGDRVAMKAFYDRYSPQLATVCYRYVDDPDDVKDVLQESFVKMFEAIGRFDYRGEGSLRAWATRIVVNESLRFIGRRRRLCEVSTPESALPDLPDDLPEPDLADVPAAVILDMIRDLPAGYRTVFNLYVFEGRSHRDIAALLGISENTSASQLHRARKMLAARINQYNQSKTNDYGQSVDRRLA